MTDAREAALIAALQAEVRKWVHGPHGFVDDDGCKHNYTKAKRLTVCRKCAIERILSEAPQSKVGDYSCALCGFGMIEPCTHWKEMLANSEAQKEVRPIMSEFRKKPVVIEAFQFAHDGANAGEVLNFTGGIIAELREPHIAIKTMEGVMLANPGDWIIRGVKGEFYPCKPDIFDATYEPVRPGASASADQTRDELSQLFTFGHADVQIIAAIENIIDRKIGAAYEAAQRECWIVRDSPIKCADPCTEDWIAQRIGMLTPADSQREIERVRLTAVLATISEIQEFRSLGNWYNRILGYQAELESKIAALDGAKGGQ